MEIKNQVCTLAQAKRLKELGVEQDSLCWYVHHLETELVVAFGYSWTDDPGYECYPNKWSAFTVAELGAMLHSFAHIPLKSDMNDYWYLYLDKYEQFKTEAEARAALLIFRLEKAAITATEVNHFLQTHNHGRKPQPERSPEDPGDKSAEPGANFFRRCGSIGHFEKYCETGY